MIKITTDHLRKFSACEYGRNVFSDAFPKGVTITKNNLRSVAERAAEQGVDFEWAAEMFLKAGARKEYYDEAQKIWNAYYENKIGDRELRYQRAMLVGQALNNPAKRKKALTLTPRRKRG